MGNPNVSSKARFMFERLFTGKVDFPQESPPREQVDFLRLFQPVQNDFPPRVHVCLSGVAQSTLVSLGGNTRRPLNNVRIRFLAGPFWRLFRCASCGWAKWIIDEVVGGPQFSCCPLCKALPSATKCAMWHTYGVCSECTTAPEDDCPFSVPSDRGSVAAAHHVG